MLGNGTQEALDQLNAARGTRYTLTGQDYPSGAYSVGWSNYPYDYWNLWVNPARQGDTQEATLAQLSAQYRLVVWKHCYPVSSIGVDAGLPSVSSAAQTLGNFQLQYQALKTAMRAQPFTRFLVWTGAVQLQAHLSAGEAQRMKQFVDWLRTTWDEPGDNIYLFDFYALETAGSTGGLYLNPAYAASGSDDHPSESFARTIAAPRFAKRMADVLAGQGDRTSLTGD